MDFSEHANKQKISFNKHIILRCWHIGRQTHCFCCL